MGTALLLAIWRFAAPMALQDALYQFFGLAGVMSRIEQTVQFRSIEHCGNLRILR